MSREPANADEEILLLLTETDLANKLGVSIRTLQAQRLRGGGIPYVKVGRCVRYSVGEVQRYLTRQRRLSTSDDGSATERAAR